MSGVPHILNLEKKSQIKLGKYDKALELSDQLIKQYPTHLLLQEVLYGKGLIYKYYLNNSESASKIFTQVIEQYPKEMIAESAKEELASMGLNFDEKEIASTNTEEGFSIHNFPNPFNPTTTIEYSIPQDANVKIIIYDIMGELVKTLTSDIQNAGKYKTVWDGTNSSGSKVASGIYIYRFEAATLKDNKHFEKSAKLILVK